MAQRDHIAGAPLELTLQRDRFDAGQQRSGIRTVGLQTGLQATGQGERPCQSEGVVFGLLELQVFDELRHGPRAFGVFDRPEHQPPRQPVAGRQVQVTTTPGVGPYQAEDLVVCQRMHRHDEPGP
jgi:hypothetical protein